MEKKKTTLLQTHIEEDIYIKLKHRLIDVKRSMKEVISELISNYISESTFPTKQE